MTASAWRTSAGTAARLRVARCTNLVRTLKDYAAKGLMIVGLDADGTIDTDDFELATSPLVLVVGLGGPRAGPAHPDRLRRDGVASRWPARWSR